MNLLSPTTVGEISVKNKVALAPLTRSRAGTSRLANKLMATYYAQRASAGLLISEATVISKDGIGWRQSPAIWSDEQAESWKQVTSAVHQAGSAMVLQLWHCGRASHSSFPERDKQLPAAPSAVKLNGEYIHTPSGKMEYETPRELTTDEIAQTVRDYAAAAARAKLAGFDGIEIHAANGYLIDQFLQSKINHRQDRYGGSVEKRFTFLQEIVEACLTVWPAGRIGVRLSPNGVFNDMGSPDFRETFTYVASRLNEYKLAYLHVLDGLAFGFHELGKPMELAEFRAVFSGSLIGNCGYTKEAAESAVSEGMADMIAFGRPFISNPDLVERFRNDWPLADTPEVSVWYSFDEKGYADFPMYQE